MKIISFDSARVTLLFPLEEAAPLGGADGSVIIKALTAKYNFLRPPNWPAPREDLEKNGMKFETGRFDFEGSPVNILTLAVYSDGVVVDANTTERASAFLDEVITWLRSDFGFRDFITQPKRYFLSQLVVEFEKPMSRLVVEYEKIAQAIDSKLAPIYNTPAGLVKFARLDFEINRAGLQAGLPRFFIERRSGASLSQERYYCNAPMPTASHIEVLEEIERTID